MKRMLQRINEWIRQSMIRRYKENLKKYLLNIPYVKKIKLYQLASVHFSSSISTFSDEELDVIAEYLIEKSNDSDYEMFISFIPECFLWLVDYLSLREMNDVTIYFCISKDLMIELSEKESALLFDNHLKWVKENNYVKVYYYRLQGTFFCIKCNSSIVVFSVLDYIYQLLDFAQKNNNYKLLLVKKHIERKCIKLNTVDVFIRLIYKYDHVPKIKKATLQLFFNIVNDIGCLYFNKGNNTFIFVVDNKFYYTDFLRLLEYCFNYKKTFIAREFPNFTEGEKYILNKQLKILENIKNELDKHLIGG